MKFVNVSDSQSFAPRPQPVYRNSGEGKRLTSSSFAHSCTRSVMRYTLQFRGITEKDRIRNRRARTREAPTKQTTNENRRTRLKEQSGRKLQILLAQAMLFSSVLCACVPIAIPAIFLHVFAAAATTAADRRNFPVNGD